MDASQKRDGSSPNTKATPSVSSEEDIKEAFTTRPLSLASESHPENTPEENVESSTSETPKDGSEDMYKPKSLKFWLIILSAFVSMFLVALDRTILATAVPRITDDFNSLGDVGWYGSGYMLTTAAFQLLFGRIYRFYDLRWTFLICIVIFAVGSTICGAAPSSTVFIVGRAIAGVGAAGISTGSMMTIIPLVPLHKRPMYQSLFGVVFGIASVAGPLIGGAFTQKVSWRWCFYINLPFSLIAFVFLYFFRFTVPKPKRDMPLIKQIIQLDPLGTFFFIPSIVSLLLALQWGGSTYEWSNWRIIILFVFFALAGIAFGVVQVTMPESASLPVRVIKQRTMFMGTFYMLFLSGSMMLCAYYIPFWMQTTHDVNPVDSGIYTIPLVLSLVVASIFSGVLTQKSGYYSPSMIISPCLAMVGEGLLTTFTPTTGSSKWIAYQFLTGFGVGFGMQTVGLAVQATVPKEDISIGMAIMFFAQQLGGAIFVSVGQTILSTGVVSRLSHIPGLDPKQIVSTGATQLHNIVAPQFLSAVKDAYNHSCTRIFLAALVISAVQLLVAFGVPWKSIKKNKVSNDTESAQITQAEKSPQDA